LAIDGVLAVVDAVRPLRFPPDAGVGVDRQAAPGEHVLHPWPPLHRPGQGAVEVEENGAGHVRTVEAPATMSARTATTTTKSAPTATTGTGSRGTAMSTPRSIRPWNTIGTGYGP